VDARNSRRESLNRVYRGRELGGASRRTIKAGSLEVAYLTRSAVGES